ncbi:MAG: alkaline phosphatase family protein, partial [Acidimicrobiia bacterium]
MADGVARRSFLLGLGAASGLALAGCRPWRHHDGHGSWRLGQPGDRPNPWRAEGTDLLPQVEHIVIYMQENHSYDSYFGMFHRGDGYCVRNGVATN